MTAQVLAVSTTDATTILRVGPIVIKHYRPTHFDPLWRRPGAWQQQIRDRIAFSRNPPPLPTGFAVNPVLWFTDWLAFSAFVPGRMATWEEAKAFRAVLPETVQDLKPGNVIACRGVLVLIDFELVPVRIDRKLGVLRTLHGQGASPEDGLD